MTSLHPIPIKSDEKLIFCSLFEELAGRLLCCENIVASNCFAVYSGTKSLPFSSSKHGCGAVKVIDLRDCEVVRVMGVK